MSTGKFLLLVKEEDDVTRSPDDIPKACLENPEMRMLLRHRRIHQMACQNGRIRLNLQLEDTICDWIKSRYILSSGGPTLGQHWLNAS